MDKQTSRHPVYLATAGERDETNETEYYVASITRNAVPKAMTLNEVEIATANDRVSQAIMLSIVIPTELQNKAVDITHQGYLGIVKTKVLMRENVWFPSMDKLVEIKAKSCLACQIATPVMNREPLKMSTLPDQPCEEMSVDFAHVDGEILLLVIDDYSTFPFVEPVAFEAASAVIPKFDKILATFGTPMQYCS